MGIRVKRIYEPAESGDGYRVLVDGLWPRGFTKRAARIDLWLREIAPSTALRRWFHHEPARWNVFRSRYAAELRDKSALLAPLKARAKKGPVTLLYAARDERHNHAMALQSYLKKPLQKTKK